MHVIAGIVVALLQAADWTPAGETNGITVAYRDNKTLDAREVRATAELLAPVDRIFALVCDFSTYPAWLSGIEEARLVSGTIPDQYEFYFRYEGRYLIVSSRDVAMRVEGGARGNGAFGCQWSEVAGRVPERSGTVRMPLYRGSWTVEPVGGGRSRVTDQAAVRPGGSVPDGLVRQNAVSELRDVMEQLRRRLRGAAQARAIEVSWQPSQRR